MRIGIDMLAVQEADRASNGRGRFGRHLVESILTRADRHQFVLYAHDGLPLGPVPPSGRGVVRKVLDTIPTLGSSRRRPTIQRLLDQNPDGLDWLVLLDPITPHYGGIPPTPPLNGPKLASVVLGASSLGSDEGRWLALRRHDALLAVTESAAGFLRRELGLGSSRVVAIGPAAGPGFAPDDSGEPLSSTTASQLGQFGIFGPFLLHVAEPGRPDGDAAAWIDLFGRLPIELRHRHHLVVLGQSPTASPRLGSRAGLIAIPEVDEATLQLLTRRCSAWLGGLRADGSGLPMVEALRSGVPVVAARSAGSVEVVGDAGLLIDPDDPDGAASELAELLGNPLLETDLRERARRRSMSFDWETSARTVLAVLTGAQAPAATAVDAPTAGRAGLRFDASHVVRPRVAYFPSGSRPASSSPRAERSTIDGTPGTLLDRYQIDCYVEPSAGSPADPLSIALGGFDVRLFERNDDLLDYHVVIYQVAEVDDARRWGARLARRPGLVLLEAEAILDALVGKSHPQSGEAGELAEIGGSAPLLDAEALGFLRDLLRTGSRVVVRSPRHFDLLHDRLGLMAESVLLAPRAVPASPPPFSARLKARARLDLWDDTVVVGQFPGPGELPIGPEALATILRDAPNLVLATFGPIARSERARLIHQARRLGLSDRFLLVPAIEPERVAEVMPLLDLAIHRGPDGSGVDLADLLRARVATVALGVEGGEPAPCRLREAEADHRALTRLILELALDTDGRAALAQAGFDYAQGTADPATARRLLIDAIERCAAELPRASGRPPVRPSGPARRPVLSPHLARPTSLRGDGVIPRSR